MNTSYDPRTELSSAEQQGRLIATLAAAELKDHRKDLGDILCELHNADQISLTSAHNLSAIDALEHNNFWTVFQPLNKAIPGLKCSHLGILNLVSRLVKKAGSDGAAGMPNLSLAIWSKRNPVKAHEIINGIKKLDDLCLAHGLFAVTGLSDEAIAFDLVRQPNISVRGIGLRALGRMEPISVDGIRHGVDEAIGVIEREADAHLRVAAMEAAFRLWERLGPTQPYLQRELIEAIGERGDATELSVLSAMLLYHDKGLPRESVDQVLGLLERLPSNSAATLSSLNQAIKENDERWDFKRVVSVFGACIPSLENGVRKKEYYAFSKWVWGYPDHTSYLFAEWLNGGEFSLCSFLANLLGPGLKGTGVWLEKPHLPLSAGDQIFMARKCIGFLWHHEVTAASILLSIVKYGNAKAKAEAEKLLFDPLLLSYGGDLRTFLDAQCSNVSKRISECAKRLCSRHDAHIAGLESAQEVVEMRPSTERRHAVAMKDRDRNRDIQKGARKQSIFADIMTHQTLLYGRKIFHIIHGSEGNKHPNISELSEFSHSIELPRLMVIDPVGFNAKLASFRAMKRHPA